MSRIALPNLRIGGLRQFSFGDPVYDRANLYPNLDLDFATNKNLTDNKSGKTSLVSFSRSAASSPGTYVDSQGLVKKAAVNLALYSEQFDNAYWAKNLAVLSANQINSPDGKQTADKLSPNSTLNPNHYVGRDTITVESGKFYTASIYAKKADYRYVSMTVYNGTSYYQPIFDLQDGVFTSLGIGNQALVDSEHVGDGWYRISTSVITTSTTARFRVYVTTSPTSFPSYSGDGVSGLHIWGAQLEETDPALMGPSAYIKTTSQTLCAPRFDHQPTSGNITTNLLLYSEMLDTVWASAGTGTTVNSNATTAPDGTLTADEVVALAGTSSSRRQILSTTPVSDIYTFSFWVKASTSTTMRFGIYNGSFITSSATVLSGSGSITGSSIFTITGLDSGWTKVSVTTSAAIPAISTQVYFYPGASPASGGESVYLWGIQFEKSSSAGTYVRTLGETRSISDATAESLGLLVEEQRTNDIDYSHDTTTGNYGTTNITDTINQAVSPDGQNTAAKIEINVSSGNRTFRYRTLSSSASTAYTVSFWVKNVDMPLFSMVIFSIDGGGVFTQISSANYTSQVNGTEWSRVTHTFTSIASTTRLEIQFLRDQGTTGNSFYYWGGQLEVGSFATSTIIREGATPTRYADVAAIQDEDFSVTNLLSYSESFDVGWLYAGTTAIVTANAATAPDGQNTADEITAGVSGINNYLGITASISGFRTASVYVKKNTADFITVNFGGGTADAAWFDLTNGVVATVNGLGNASMTPVGDGWFRITHTKPSAGSVVFFNIPDSDGSFSSTAGKSAYLWGAQLTATEIPVDYISTRNLLRDSQDFERSAWTKSALLSWNDGYIDPFGDKQGYRFVENSSLGNHGISTSVTYTADDYVMSFYGKAGDRRYIEALMSLSDGNSFAVFDLLDGTVISSGTGTTATISAAGNGWFRCQLTKTLAAGATTTRVRIGQNSSTFFYTGDGSSDIYLFGFQIEPGTTATEYYRTYDVVGKNYNWYEPTEATVFVEAVPQHNNFKSLVDIGIVSTINRNTVSLLDTVKQANAATLVSGLQMTATTANLFTLGQSTLVAVGFRKDDLAISMNGGTVATDTPGEIYGDPILMTIGQRIDKNIHLNGHIKRLICFPRRTKDSNLVLMTE